MIFELEGFIQHCRSICSGETSKRDSQEAISALLAEAVSDPKQVLKELGVPEIGGLNTLYHAENLTILNIVWAPGMTLHPHNHCMWANIGIYGGQEENNFYQRTADGLIQQGQTMLNEQDVAPLHEDVIHAVHNPLSKLTAAIHVYGGDFFSAPRSEWSPDTLEEHPYDIEHTRAVFAEANARMKQDVKC